MSKSNEFYREEQEKTEAFRIAEAEFEEQQEQDRRDRNEDDYFRHGYDNRPCGKQGTTQLRLLDGEMEVIRSGYNGPF